MKNRQAKIIDGVIIFQDCISVIKQLENENFKLYLFDNCKVIFEKEYKTFTAAKIQETKLLKKFSV